MSEKGSPNFEALTKLVESLNSPEGGILCDGIQVQTLDVQWNSVQLQFVLTLKGKEMFKTEPVWCQVGADMTFKEVEMGFYARIPFIKVED